MALTSKELTGLEDLLTQEDIIIKKYQSYSTLCTDSAIKEKFDLLVSKHSQVYSTLLSQLQ